METLKSSSRMTQFHNMPLPYLDGDIFLDSIQPAFDLIPRDQLDHEDSLFSTLLNDPSPESISTGDLELLHSLSDMLMSQGEADPATLMQCNGQSESSIWGTITHVNMSPTQHSNNKDIWKLPEFLPESSMSPSDLRLDLGYIHTQFHTQKGTPESSSGVLPILEVKLLDKGFSPSVNEATATVVAEVKHMDSDVDNYSDATEDTEERGKWGGSGKAPISKNLASERRRRKKLNERLYSLRAIVPKISKMDKASIVGDAINYVQDLQKQVEDMKAEIANLEANTDSTSTSTSTITTTNSNTSVDLPSLVHESCEMHDHKILEFEVSKMEEEMYHMHIHCKKGSGVLVQLSRAIEALDFEIINANLTSFDDRVINAIIVKVKNNIGMSKAEHVKRMVLDVVPKFRLHL